MIPRLHLVLDLPAVAQAGRDPVAVATAAVHGGVGAVHLRAPGYGARTMLSLVLALRNALEGTALLLVNDRVDVALAGGADGVQLPASGLAPDRVRALVECVRGHTGGAPGLRRPGAPDLLAAPALGGFVLGVSVHAPDAAGEAARAGADFVLLGTVYPSASHPGGVSGGEALVRATHAATRLPLIAIGGITPENVAPVLAAGAAGVAVIRAIVDAPDPEEAAAALLRALG